MKFAVMSVISQDPIRLFVEGEGPLSLGAVFTRIFLAVLLAAAIGLERSNKRHAAGLRTFTLASLSGAMTVLLDLWLMQTFNSRIPVLSALAILGMALLSSNSVLFNSRSQIKGLTTSYALWACGTLGFLAGAGMYSLLLIAFFFLMLILVLLPACESYLKDRSNHFEIHLELTEQKHLWDFLTTLRKLGIQIDDIELNHAYAQSGLGVYSLLLKVVGKELKTYKTHQEIIEALSSLDYVSHIEEIH